MNPNDPMSQFKERYQQYVETKAPTSPPVMNASGGKGFFNKFYVQGLIVGVVIIVSGVLVYLNFKPGTPLPPQQNKIVTAPSPTPKTAITVTDAQIDLYLMNEWQQYYSKVKDDQKFRDSAKEVLIKKQILASAATKYNLDLSSIASDNPKEKDSQTEDELKQKVLTWRNIDYVYVFLDVSVPKYQSYPEKVTYSYNLIKKYLNEGKTMQEAYDLAKKDAGFFKSITLTTNKQFFKDGWDKSIADLLFTYKKGENTEIISPPGGVYLLAHINDANDTQFGTMEEWLNAQNQ